MTAVPAAPAPIDLGDAYLQVRRRVGELLAGRTGEEAARIVPACPRWTVQQTLAHLAGGCSDVLAGRTDGAPGDEWTGAHVAARSDRSIDELLTEWSADAPQLVTRLAGTLALGQVVMDALSHEYDLRAALGAPVPADDPVVSLAVAWLGGRFGRYLAHVGVRALAVDVDGVELVLGSGEAAATLRATPLDVFRSLTGRRTREQVERLDWDGDPAPYLDALTWGPFSPPAHAVEPPAPH